MAKAKTAAQRAAIKKWQAAGAAASKTTKIRMRVHAAANKYRSMLSSAKSGPERHKLDVKLLKLQKMEYRMARKSGTTATAWTRTSRSGVKHYSRPRVVRHP
jgi:hypothetical protein